MYTKVTRLGRGRTGLETQVCLSRKRPDAGNALCLEFMLVLAASLCFFLRKKTNI
jgi:hypothetical protein